MERKSSARAVKDAAVELQYVARKAGVIGETDRIIYIPGSRSYGQPPEVEVRSTTGAPKPFVLLPDFDHLTREREVAVAMEAVTATLKVLTAYDKLP